MQFESKGQEEFVDLKAELLVEGSLERWKYERELEWREVKRREEESRRSERPAPPTKSLYEQLKERNDMKEADREQKRSLKNYIYTGPSEEELNLIQSISTCEADQRMKIEQEERKGMEEFKKIMESAKREEIAKETMDIVEVIQNDSASNLKGKSAKTPKKSLKESVVVKNRGNKKRPNRGKDVSESTKKENGTNSKEITPDISAVEPPAKRPALVSYSSDSDSDVGGKGKNKK